MNPNVNPYMNAQMQALMDYRSTEPTPATGFGGRVMPGMAQPVQPVAQQTSGVQALSDYYRQRGSPPPGSTSSGWAGGEPPPFFQGGPQDQPSMLPVDPNGYHGGVGNAGQQQPQMSGPAIPINASNNAGPWNPLGNMHPTANPIMQPREMQSSFVTTPNTPSANYSPPMSPQVQALYNRQRMQ